jgi:hypothetical protein
MERNKMELWFDVDRDGDHVFFQVEWATDKYRLLLWLDTDKLEPAGWSYVEKDGEGLVSAYGKLPQELIDAILEWAEYMKEN